MPFPFLGRLHAWEYLTLITSLVLVFLEGLIRFITLLLPGPIINVFYRSSRRAYNYLAPPHTKQLRSRHKAFVKSIAQACDFVELCELFGYTAEEHIVHTRDGYLLGLHRLGWKLDEEGTKVNSGNGSVQKRVVYLHHGLMMNSEAWVCLTERERCLPFALVERGYDVWLGNNRGNKYSKKSTKCNPTDTRFWSFSIDQFAFHDIPDSIQYILSTTRQSSLSYIGFSQGTAQALATLSIHPSLNDVIDVFIALAPAMSPPGLNHGVVDSFVKTSPEVLFLAFGRRAILTSTAMWQALLYPPIFVRIIDLSLSFLFGWHTQNISPHQKLAAYPHLYSFTSTKSVVHWFQIMRNGKFQMYDDELQSPFNISDVTRFYKVAKFPTRNIRTKTVVIYGGTDSLVDLDVMLKELPKSADVRCVDHYEHLDFLWAHDVHAHVFPHVFEALHTYAQHHGTASATTQIPTPGITTEDHDGDFFPSLRSPSTTAGGGGQTLTSSATEAGTSTEDDLQPKKHTETTSSHGQRQRDAKHDTQHPRPPSSAGTTPKRPATSRVPVPISSPPSAPAFSSSKTAPAPPPEGLWASEVVGEGAGPSGSSSAAPADAAAVEGANQPLTAGTGAGRSTHLPSSSSGNGLAGGSLIIPRGSAGGMTTTTMSSTTKPQASSLTTTAEGAEEQALGQQGKEEGLAVPRRTSSKASFESVVGERGIAIGAGRSVVGEGGEGTATGKGSGSASGSGVEGPGTGTGTGAEGEGEEEEGKRKRRRKKGQAQGQQQSAGGLMGMMARGA